MDEINIDLIARAITHCGYNMKIRREKKKISINMYLKYEMLF